jgi:spore coat polysaccharide biosynthesis protein SpsF
MHNQKPRIVAIVQARMGSTRLPEKVLMDIEGHSVLARVVQRLSRATLVDEIVIATTTLPADSAIVAEADRLGMKTFRGSEHDVLERYMQAAEAFLADVVVRITSDCPLIDAGVVDDVLRTFLAEHADFAYNDIPHSFPRGLDVEAFSLAALRGISEISTRKYEREHVTPAFYEHPEIFKTVVIRSDADFSDYRWTLDTPEDLRLIRAIYAHFADRDDFGWREIVHLMQRSPELAAMNSHVVQKCVREVAAHS